MLQAKRVLNILYYSWVDYKFDYLWLFSRNIQYFVLLMICFFYTYVIFNLHNHKTTTTYIAM